MPRKKSEWTPWKAYARKLHNGGGYTKLIHWMQKEYPKSVTKAVIAALTVAEVMLEAKGEDINDIGLCRFYGHSCSDCPGGVPNEWVCSFPVSDKAGIEAVKKTYARLYKKMPAKWKRVM